MSIEFHRRMLADRVRHEAFRAALKQAITPGRSTVADIGAGTGVLAFFARELGAREVWLYDPGPALGLAEAVAARNGIEGLHFVPERSLDVADPPRVDVVVAEVLGNFAYEEDVLETLRDARRFLAAGRHADSRVDRAVGRARHGGPLRARPSHAGATSVSVSIGPMPSA